MIMPFAEAPNRNANDLSYFFREVKSGIENCDSLTHKYKVFRSEDHFDITPHII